VFLLAPEQYVASVRGSKGSNWKPTCPLRCIVQDSKRWGDSGERKPKPRQGTSISLTGFISGIHRNNAGDSRLKLKKWAISDNLWHPWVQIHHHVRILFLHITVNSLTTWTSIIYSKAWNTSKTQAKIQLCYAYSCSKEAKTVGRIPYGFFPDHRWSIWPTSTRICWSCTRSREPFQITLQTLSQSSLQHLLNKYLLILVIWLYHATHGYLLG